VVSSSSPKGKQLKGRYSLNTNLKWKRREFDDDWRVATLDSIDLSLLLAYCNCDQVFTTVTLRWVHPVQ